MDEREWMKLLSKNDPAKHLNSRYLVVPVSTTRGVFHPKVVTLLGENGIAAGVHSANITRPGYSYNLEFLNAAETSTSERDPTAVSTIYDSLDFLKRISLTSLESASGAIANEWIHEASKWLDETFPKPTSTNQSIIWDTNSGPFWPRLKHLWDKDSFDELVVISPFFDKSNELLRRVAEDYPGTRTTLIVQNGTSTLNTIGLNKLDLDLNMISIESHRRLHAKSFFWRTGEKWTALSGSANWTSAALDGRNVEVSMLISDAPSPFDLISHESLKSTPIEASTFRPGAFLAPEDSSDSTFNGIRIASASLTEANGISINLMNPKSIQIQNPVVDLLTSNNPDPVSSLELRKTGNGTFHVVLPKSLKLGSGLKAVFRGSSDDLSITTPAIWVIQRSKLEHDPRGNSSRKLLREIHESGKGLDEHLDALGNMAGPLAIASYLQNLSIRFLTGPDLGNQTHKMFSLKVRDPYRGNNLPAWMLELHGNHADLRTAIEEFVDRHLKKHLRRHAKSGNIGGVDNFLDVLSCMIRLLYRYRLRSMDIPLEDQLVTGGFILGRLPEMLMLATTGIEKGKLRSPGFLTTLKEQMRGDQERLRLSLIESNYFPILSAILCIAQIERSYRAPPGTHSSSLLKEKANLLISTANDFNIKLFPTDAIPVGLDSLGLDSEEALNIFELYTRSN
tara:strand:- start:188462 stop:190498 length:2037 start_codon:yes stop_codon:yes gene_type:complete